MHILVAGGAGFIGSNLCESLLSKGYRITCLDNFITSSKSTISHLLENPSFSLVSSNIIEWLPESLTKEKFDYIFHLASPASPNKKSPRSYIAFPIETLLVNSQGTYHLLELARKTNASFLYVSTSEVYGNPQVSPQSEDYFGNVNPNGIRSVYDEGKRYGEAMTMAYLRKYDLNVRIVRIFNTFGPHMQKDDGRVVSNFITQALHNQPLTIYGDGLQTRSFCFIDDMVEGLERAMFSEHSKGLVVNLGNPDERKIIDIAKLITTLTNTTSEITHEEMPEDDPKTRCPDITRAKQVLSWEPKVPLEDGLKKTIEYFRA